jgi:hypothetical protein
MRLYQPLQAAISGSLNRCSRYAAACAKRISIARRVAGAIRCSRSLTQNLGAIGVSQDESCVTGHDFSGHTFGNCKKELVAMCAIVLPFGVSAKIRDGRFDFDDQNSAVGCQRHDVCAPSRKQGAIRRRSKNQAAATSAASRARQTSLGLAAILGREGFEQWHGTASASETRDMYRTSAGLRQPDMPR